MTLLTTLRLTLSNDGTALSTAEPNAAEEAAPELSETVISSNPRVQMMQALRDLLEYRELFFAFVSRNILIRYKQTMLGVVWVILQPLITGFIFAGIMRLITGQMSGMQALVFFMAGLVPWTSFQNGVQMASMSLETNANLVSKVYFPRMTVPASQVISSVVDFAIAFVTLVIISLVAGVFNFGLILWMFPLLLIQLIAALGLGFFFAALNAQYRDVKYMIPFLLQLGMFVTVWIPLERWRAGEIGLGSEWSWLSPYLYELLSLNPMAGVVETYRAVLSGTDINWLLLGKGVAISAVLLVVGARFFAAREKRLVDVL